MNPLKNRLSIGFLMGETFKLVGKHISMAIPAHGIDMTTEQFVLLNVINSKDEVNQQELSTIMNKDKSGILRLTDELERKKMVVRIADSDDRRKKSLVLTKKGVETLNQVLEIEASVFEKLLAGVSEEDLAVFSKVLYRIHDNGKD